MNRRLTKIYSILVLSYYHPWVAGGGHRPRRLMTQDLLRNHEVCFLFIDDNVQFREIAKQLSQEPNSAKLHVARTLSGEEMVFENSSLRWQGILSVDALLSEFSPDIIRVHNPSEHHINMARKGQETSAILLYDQMDLWDEFTSQPWGCTGEKWYLDNADFISTVSNYLANRQTRCNIEVIPNGVSASFITACAERRRAKQLRPDFDIVYAGALWPDWLDWKLVEFLVENTPSTQWCFVGSVVPPVNEDHCTEAISILERLGSQSNVTVLNEVDHFNLVDILVNSRIGLVPFQINPLTLAASPIKIYDYLAANLTVICFNTSEFVGVEKVILCSTPSEYLFAIEATLSSNHGSSEDSLRQWLEFNTWEQRIEQMEQFVTSQLVIQGDEI